MGIWEDRAMTEARVKNNILFASLICCSIALAGCQTTENLRTAQTPPDISADNPLTVMSFNIRLGIGPEGHGKIYRMNWGQNLDEVIVAIRSANPDVVGLQEVAGIDQIRKLAIALNMNYAFEWHDTGSNRAPWWGVGILSKYSIRDARGVQISSGRGNTKHIVTATVDAGQQDLMFVSIHKDKDLVDGSSITNILASVENAGMPVVLIGDLNITPGDPRLERIIERFIDTATVENSENAEQARIQGTFHASGRRIDYVFAQKEFFNVVDAGLVAREHRRASDHYAYFAKLTLKRSLPVVSMK